MGKHIPLSRRITIAAAMLVTAGLLTAACRDTNQPTGPGSASSAASLQRSNESARFTKVPLDRCTFVPDGQNKFMNLTPGYTLVLAGQDVDEFVDLRITVLNQTKQIEGITTRVIEERELKNGRLYEIALNYFAMCKETNSVFYFGEDVDFYNEKGEIISHAGSWLHGVDGAVAGLQMPGLPLIGSRYFQEVAPGVALDRAHILRLDETVTTPFARFSDVLLTEESSPLSPGVKEEKFYAPDIGLIKDGPVLLVKAGFNIP